MTTKQEEGGEMKRRKHILQRDFLNKRNEVDQYFHKDAQTLKLCQKQNKNVEQSR